MKSKLSVKDADAAMKDGSFFGMSPADAAVFARDAVSNPDDDLDSSAAFDYLMGEYGQRMAAQVFAESVQVATAYGDARRNMVNRAVSDAAGMSAAQFDEARVRHNAGESSDILRAYGKFLRSC